MRVLLMIRFFVSLFGINRLLRALSGRRELSLLVRIAKDNYIQEHLFNNPKYRDPKKLNKYESQSYSQNGEDGIIQEILARIGETNKYFVEIGAGNGLQNNTVVLLMNNWSGHWIEAAPNNIEIIQDRFKFLIASGSLSVDSSKVSENTIEELLEGFGVPEEFDLLSIDIDGIDYWVWKSLNYYRPRIVVIEYNAHYPPTFRWVQKYDTNRNWDGSSYFGASLKSLEILGSEKGYCLVGCDFAGVNACFVRRDLVQNQFSPPYTAENHYEPPRYFLSGSRGHYPGIGEFLNI